ncbi:MAG: class I SAM-dependent methyltransferase [Proteobacteria bacterium]|nr:class I SAM-dependent methyltransferase [Pseudomonadota bacterium]
MKTTDLSILTCLECRGDISFQRGVVTESIIDHGILECSKCGTLYPVIDTVAIMFKKEIALLHLCDDELNFLRTHGYEECIPAAFDVEEEYLKQVEVASNWEYQWTKQYNYSNEDFSKNYFLSEEMFYEFIPLSYSDVFDKDVCIICSGKGREAHNILLRKPARVVCCEIGSEIYQTRHVVANKDLVLIKSDAMDIPLKDNAMGLVLCDHALQHVLDHRRAYSEMSRVASPHGVVCINVYSLENNFIMTKLVDPSKFIIHKLPLSFINYLSILPAILVYIAIYCLYVPANKISKKVASFLPLNDHMIYWSKYNSFKTIWTWCFDLIHAPISYHFSKDEVMALAFENNLKLRFVENIHGTTWTTIAEKYSPS